MIELFLSISGHINDRPILLDVLDVNVQFFKAFSVFVGDSPFVHNVTGHLWNHVVTNEQKLRCEDR